MTSRFCGYIEKMFGFRGLVGMIEDTRVEPQISAGSAWLSGLFMFAMGRGSLNAIDGDLRVPKMMERVVGKTKPSGDSIGRIFCLFATEGAARHTRKRLRSRPVHHLPDIAHTKPAGQLRPDPATSAQESAKHR